MPRLDLLQQLSAELRSASVPDNQFVFEGFRILFDMGTWKRKRDCQTTCCAAGLAVETLPAWKDVFSFVDNKDSWGSIMVYIVRKTESELEDFSVDVIHRNPASVYTELALGLDIRQHEAETIFDPLEYFDGNGHGIPANKISPTVVADRIDRIVRSYQFI